MIVAREPAGGYLPALDGLRGIAALAVVALHLGERLQLPLFPDHGYLAVPFFFVLSGYVIARAYEERWRRGMTTGRFIEVRLIRLYPLVLAGLAIAWLAGASSRDAALAALMLPALRQVELFPANGAQWSLFLELAGNLVHVCGRRFASDRLITAVMLAGGGATIGAAAWFGTLEVEWAGWNLAGGVALFAFSYAAGILIFRRADRIRALCPPVPLNAIVLVFTLALVLPSTREGWAGPLRDGVSAVLLFPLLMVAALNASPAKWQEAVCRFLGALSYPLYIIHFPIVITVRDLLKDQSLTTAARYGCAAATALLCVAAAWALHRYFDQPVRGLLSDWARTRRREPSAGPA